MPTKPKSVTIELTPKQQEKLRKLTGQDHAEIRVEVSKGRTAKGPLSAKLAPRRGVWIDSPERGGNAGGVLPMV